MVTLPPAFAVIEIFVCGMPTQAIVSASSTLEIAAQQTAPSRASAEERTACRVLACETTGMMNVR